MIEIIVTLIILGVLAAIAIPNIFTNIEKTRVVEAYSTLNIAKNLVEGCILKTSPTNSNCIDTAGSILTSIHPGIFFNAIQSTNSGSDLSGSWYAINIFRNNVQLANDPFTSGDVSCKAGSTYQVNGSGAAICVLRDASGAVVGGKTYGWGLYSGL